MCSKAGVILVYLPPYSPDLNPIEEFFAELKGFVGRTRVTTRVAFVNVKCIQIDDL
jgi:transposase